MAIEYHVIDVFTDKLFHGNPAGVCLLESWLPDDTMQSIAAENNLSETAFLVKQEGGLYGLRWFTPAIEIDLCGHATLASAFVLFDEQEKTASELKFETMSGPLSVTREGDLYVLNLPAAPTEECFDCPVIKNALGVRPFLVYRSIDFLVLLGSEDEVRAINPDFALLKQLKSEMGHDRFGVIVTASGNDCDFVSRYFAPNVGVDEDPVTGRAHCTLTPFWAARLGKKVMSARQLSQRGGVLKCEECGDRVKIGGRAVRYLRGHLTCPVY